MFNVVFSEGIKNIDKNKFITYLSVILFTLLFLLQGYTYSYSSVNKRYKFVTESEAMQDYKIYNIGFRGVSPSQALRLNSQNVELETAEYYMDVESSEYLRYVGVDNNSLIIKDFKGDPSVFMKTLRNDGSFSVYSLYVTPNFHKIENYRVIEGRNFTDEDMVFVEGQPRAVLLGYKYRGIYEIGDILSREVNELSESSIIPQLKVIGFLAEDTTVISRSGDEIYDLDNYIVYPGYFIPIEEWEFCDEKVLEYALNRDASYAAGEVRILINSEYEYEGVMEFQEVINNYGGFEKYYTVLDQQQIMQKIQSRTESVAEFGTMLTVILMIFSVITVVFTVINRVENNLKDYAIHVSLGATPNHVVLFVMAEISVILSCSIILGMVATSRMMSYISMPFYFNALLIIFILTSLFIILISAITVWIALQKKDLYTIIK